MTKQELEFRPSPLLLFRVQCPRDSLLVSGTVFVGPSGNTSITTYCYAPPDWQPDRVFLPGLYISDDGAQYVRRVSIRYEEGSFALLAGNRLPVQPDFLFFGEAEITFGPTGELEQCAYRAHPTDQKLTDVPAGQAQLFTDFVNRNNCP